MIELTDKSFSIVTKSGGAFLVGFYAKWCPPCKAMEDRLIAYEQQTGIPAGRVDMQNPECRETVNRYFPKGVPTIILFLDGKPAKRVKGVVNLKEHFDFGGSHD